MARERLVSKSAGEDNDVYTMNDARPAEDKRGGSGSGEAFQKAYQKGDTSTWKEDPISTQETSKIHEEDKKRNEMNIGEMRMAFEESIKGTRDLAGLATKCMIASERMLPGADEDTLTRNAADLMFLDESSVDAILNRQASLAMDIQKKASEEEKEDGEEEKEAASCDEKEEKKAGEEKAEEEEKEAGEEKAEKAEKAEEDEEKEAAEDRLAAVERKMDEVLAALQGAYASKEEAPAEEAPAEEAPAEEAPAEEAPAEEAPVEDSEEKEASSKTASDASDDSLDSIFSATVTKKSPLSGNMVRKASESKDDELTALWGTTPDVSSVFG